MLPPCVATGCGRTTTDTLSVAVRQPIRRFDLLFRTRTELSLLLLVPPTRHLEPEGEPAVRTESRVAARDRSIGRRRSTGMEAAVLLPGPGVEREKVVAPENAQQTLGCVRTEVALGEDRPAEILGRARPVLPRR